MTTAGTTPATTSHTSARTSPSRHGRAAWRPSALNVGAITAAARRFASWATSGADVSPRNAPGANNTAHAAVTRQRVRTKRPDIRPRYTPESGVSPERLLRPAMPSLLSASATTNSVRWISGWAGTSRTRSSRSRSAGPGSSTRTCQNRVVWRDRSDRSLLSGDFGVLRGAVRGPDDERATPATEILHHPETGAVHGDDPVLEMFLQSTVRTVNRRTGCSGNFADGMLRCDLKGHGAYLQSSFGLFLMSSIWGASPHPHVDIKHLRANLLAVFDTSTCLSTP